MHRLYLDCDLIVILFRLLTQALFCHCFGHPTVWRLTLGSIRHQAATPAFHPIEDQAHPGQPNNNTRAYLQTHPFEKRPIEEGRLMNAFAQSSALWA